MASGKTEAVQYSDIWRTVADRQHNPLIICYPLLNPFNNFKSMAGVIALCDVSLQVLINKLRAKFD